jgi:multidrug efflux pump subunit AcrB
MTYAFVHDGTPAGVLSNATQIQGSGFIGLDGTSHKDDASIRAFVKQFFATQLQRSDLHPDAWDLIVHDPEETNAKLSEAAGDKYSYAELDDFFDLIARTLQGAPETSKVERRGVLPQTIYLEFSQDRLAAYGLQSADLGKLVQAHNIIAPGGVFEAGPRQITLNPSEQFENPQAIGDIVVTTATEIF